MDPQFWFERWAEGRIGFHEGRPNALLVRHLDELAGARRILVPLCGKALDLAFLAAQGFEVVGVELVESAVAAFFAERGLVPEVERRGAVVCYRHDTISILAGDFFHVTRDDVGACDAVYDRAATIALPESTRRRYADHLRSLLERSARALLVTIDYPQERMPGPPFSVPLDAVRALHSDAMVERLAASPAKDGRLAEIGAEELAIRVRFGEATRPVWV